MILSLQVEQVIPPIFKLTQPLEAPFQIRKQLYIRTITPQFETNSHLFYARKNLDLFEVLILCGMWVIWGTYLLLHASYLRHYLFWHTKLSEAHNCYGLRLGYKLVLDPIEEKMMASYEHTYGLSCGRLHVDYHWYFIEGRLTTWRMNILLTYDILHVDNWFLVEGWLGTWIIGLLIKLYVTWISLVDTNSIRKGLLGFPLWFFSLANHIICSVSFLLVHCTCIIECIIT